MGQLLGHVAAPTLNHSYYNKLRDRVVVFDTISTGGTIIHVITCFELGQLLGLLVTRLKTLKKKLDVITFY